MGEERRTGSTARARGSARRPASGSGSASLFPEPGALASEPSVREAADAAAPLAVPVDVPVEAPDGPADGAPSERRGGPRWRRLLAGESPHAVLARIADGDPLGVRAIVAARVEAGAWLVDADRVHLRALARCARHAERYAGRPPLAEWLAGVVDAALADVVREEGEHAWSPRARGDADAHGAREARGADAGAARDADDVAASAAFVELARPLGLEPAAMRAACARFNRLDVEVRRAFQALVLRGRSLDELARERREPATEIARRARRGLDALLRGDETEAMP